MLALRMQATTSDQAKQQETSMYSSSSDASECGSDGNESVDDSDPDGINAYITPIVNIFYIMVLRTKLT